MVQNYASFLLGDLPRLLNGIKDWKSKGSLIPFIRDLYDTLLIIGMIDVNVL